MSVSNNNNRILSTPDSVNFVNNENALITYYNGIAGDSSQSSDNRTKASDASKKTSDYLTAYNSYITTVGNEANAYANSADKLLTYQVNAANGLQGVNDMLSVAQVAALKDITNKRRLVQINTYYSDKYADYIFITKMIILLCAIIILLSVLARRSIISAGIYNLLVIISCVILIIIIIGRWISMGYRDPINYKQYKFYVPPYNPTGNVTLIGYGKSSTDAAAGTAENPAVISSKAFSDQISTSDNNKRYTGTMEISKHVFDL